MLQLLHLHSTSAKTVVSEHVWTVGGAVYMHTCPGWLVLLITQLVVTGWPLESSICQLIPSIYSHSPNVAEHLLELLIVISVIDCGRGISMNTKLMLF